MILCGRSGIETRASQNQTSWEGSYTFEETVRRSQGNAGNVSHEIRIYRESNKLVADLDTEGWQTTSRLKCYARVEGNRVRLYLIGFGEDDMIGKIEHKVGALLLTLERSAIGGIHRVLAHWGTFKPMSPANQISGRVYFRLAAASDIGNMRVEQNFSNGESRYYLRLFNCDDSCTADVNDGVVSSTRFATDGGWIDFTDTLEDGRNQIKLSVENQGRAIAYGFQVRKNQTMLFEQICGRAGIAGCQNNRSFPTGIARQITHEIQISPAERPLAYTQWLTFLAAFRTAVNKRDRMALRGMIAIPFETQSDGVFNSADSVIRWLNQGQMWSELQREIAPGSKFTFLLDMGQGKPTRCATDGIFCFELDRDGRWRLSSQVENEPGD